MESQHNNQNKSKQFNNLTIPQMLAKLDSMYDREEEIKIEIKKLQIEYQQLQDDKEMLQTMILFQRNRLNRMRRYGELL